MLFRSHCPPIAGTAENKTSAPDGTANRISENLARAGLFSRPALHNCPNTASARKTSTCRATAWSCPFCMRSQRWQVTCDPTCAYGQERLPGAGLGAGLRFHVRAWPRAATGGVCRRGAADSPRARGQARSSATGTTWPLLIPCAPTAKVGGKARSCSSSTPLCCTSRAHVQLGRWSPYGWVG